MPGGGLWRDHAFLELWSAQTISELGDNILQLALPLTAILVLHSTVFEVALLRGVEIVPFLLFSLPAGVWIDRLRRRPLMIAADIGRAIALVSIPIAYWSGSTSLAQLYAVAFVVGALAVVFDVSYLSFLPSIIPGSRLAEGNSKLMTTQSGAQLVGPGLGGALVGLVTAPVAILADAASFGVSAALIGAIRRHEGEPAPVESRRRLRVELIEGLRYVFRQPILRTLTVWSAAWNLFSSGLFAIALVYLVRGLHLDATTVGWIFAAGNVGAVLGAAFNTRIVARFGLGPTMALSGVVSSIAFFAFPLAPRGFPEPVLVAGGVLSTGLGMLFNVNQLTLRQAITPRRLMGRMNSVVRFMYWGTIPLGSAIGGGLATGIGLRATLLVEAAGATLVTLPIALSPLRKLVSLPEPLPAARS
jgi:MFS family permease